MERPPVSLRLKRAGWLLAGVAVLFATPAAAAASDGPALDGSVSATWYDQGTGSDNGLEASNADSRMLERVRLNARQIAPGVDFRSSFSVRHWFGGDRTGHEARVHQAYFQVRGPGQWSGLKLLAGRHWRYGTGSTGLLDGATLSFRQGPMRIETFLGTRDSELRDELRWPSLDRSKWVGFSFGTRILPWAEVGGGFSVLRRGDYHDREVLDATADVRPWQGVRFTGEYRYDTVRDYALDQRLRGSWRPNVRYEVWAEMASRRPDLGESWFLSTFSDLLDHDREEYRGGIRRTIGRELSVSADILTVDHGEASPGASASGAGWDLREPDAWSWDSSARVTWRGQTVGWYGGGGYGGERNGAVLALSRQVERRVRVGFNANLLTYEYGRRIRTDESLATMTGYVEAELDADTHLTAEVERLDNAADPNDIRLLLRLRRGFRWGG